MAQLRSQVQCKPAWALGAALVASTLSLLLPFTVTHDAWWWLIWGRDLAHLGLDTRGGSSWKPLPVFFTTPFALLGSSTAPALWLVVARSGCLLAMVLAFRVAARFGGWLAGLLAVCGLAVMDGWLSEFRLGRSEGLMTALVLGAAERHLGGRRDQALLLAGAAALLRPDFWPLLGAYGLYLLFAEPRRRLLVAIVAVAVPALWILPEWWGSGDPLRASSAAQETASGGAGLEAARQVFSFARQLVVAPILVEATAAALLAAARRNAAVVALFIGTVVWLTVIAAMAAAGYPSLPRFAIPPLAVGCVLGGIGLSWTAQLAGGPRARMAAAVVLIALTGAFLAMRADPLRREWSYDDYRTSLDRGLHAIVTHAHARQIVRSCGGAVVTYGAEVPALAWYLDHRPIFHTVRRAPVTVFRARTVGHTVRPGLPAGLGLQRVAHRDRWTILAGCRTRGSEPVRAGGPVTPTGRRL